MKQLEGRLDWDDFLQEFPEDIRDDELVRDLIELLQLQPPPGFISDEASVKYKERVLEKIGTLTLEAS